MPYKIITKVTLGLALLGCCGLSVNAQNVQIRDPEVDLKQEGLNKVDPAEQQKLANQAFWQNFKSAHPTWQAWFNEKTKLPHKAYGKPIDVQGNTLKTKANKVLEGVLDAFPIEPEQLKFDNTRSSPNAGFVTFKQTFNKKKVLTSKVKLRFTKKGALTQFSLDYYPAISDLPKPKLTPKALLSAAKKGIDGNVKEAKINGGLQILPNKGDYYLVREVTIRGEKPSQNEPFDYRTLVDAKSGDILYRKNRVVEANFNDLPLKGTVVDEYPGNGQKAVNLRHLSVEANGQTFFTDSTGELSINLPDSTQANITLEGKFASVQDRGEQSPAFQRVLDTSRSVQKISFDSAARLDQISAYHNTNTIHDYMKGLMPNFTGLDNPIEVNTGLEQGQGCNAVYNPRENSINFFEDNDQCPSFAKVADVVYHEYGHAINSVFYEENGSTFRNGALGEGYADVWGMLPPDDPVIGKGITNGPGNRVIRRYDRNPKVYPQDITGEVHDDGEIIAGAFWDMKKNLDSLDQMAQLFAATYQALPNAMEGNEGQLYRDILLEVLTANDDDNDLSNGTPDQDAITSAFARHGITLLAGIELDHTPQKLRKPNTTSDFTASIDGQLLTPIGGIRLKYKLNDDQQWQTNDLQKQGSQSVYKASISGADTGDVMTYYFQLLDQQGNVSATLPEGANENTIENLPYYTLYGFDVITHDSLNSSQGWSISGDARSGMWTFAEPVPSFIDGEPETPENRVQPASDHTGGPVNKCAVTENAPSRNVQQGFADIDNGETILISSYYNVDTLQSPVIGFHRWFSNATGTNPKNDPFEVYIQSRQGSTWTEVSNTFQPDREWRMRLIDVNSRLNQQVEAVRLRFIASDRVDNSEQQAGQSITEAAVDDVVVYERLRKGFRPVGQSDLSTRGASMTVFPNPTNGIVKINRPEQKTAVKAQVINAHGQVMERMPLGGGTTIVDFSAIAPSKGVYILKWREQGQVHHQRILYR